MDPCHFVRILVGNLAIKVPASSKLEYSSCYCKIKFKNFPTQQSAVPLVHQQQEQSQNPESNSSLNSLAACFTLNKTQLNKTLSSNKKVPSLSIEVHGRRADRLPTCGWADGNLLGRVTVLLDLRKVESRPCVMHSGWVDIGAKAQFFSSVRAEPDPRYVFQFGGEPESSPQVFQVQGSVRQAVFTCKFNLRNQGDRNLLSRRSVSEPSTSRNWLHSLGSDKDHSAKERKGWTITIHDLSGSPVAMASMVTPFVPSPGSDHVSRSNPGAWLILRPLKGTWQPWGRLEAWREHGALGYRFELLHDTIVATPTTTSLASSTISTKTGGRFTVDMTNTVATPVSSPHSSCDFGSGYRSGSGSWSGSDFGFGFLSQFLFKGFVMSSTVKASGKPSSKPEVEIGVQHVNCTEDAAAFVALAAAMDLSMDACRLFSHKLRKGLRQKCQSFVI
uniref:Formin-like protein 18 n=1 Tax=Rhizophora mucronata TaxID=61149 RepID=A0A2P2JBA9_RHIMU